ncbi:MAG TPA: 4-oxalocrotonate tautomerase family protein [Micromonosporaceae bacterium]|nr:4-oxalocrotonate tautomerase family protein [Micromonosporaceae bacterium]
MPVVRVDMWAGRTLEQKRVLARRLTWTVAEVAGCNPSEVQVVFQDYAPEDWAVAGQLLHDRLAESQGLCRCQHNGHAPGHATGYATGHASASSTSNSAR